MPVLSRFFGIVIKMYFLPKEHNPPHIHALYDGYEATFFISDGEIFQGKFPRKQSSIVKEFVDSYREELLKMWETETYYYLPFTEVYYERIN